MSGRDIGIVVIGRNEGPRLAACLRSLGPHIHSTVYVDSGSTDGSPEMAEGMGAIVERLDMTQPFTAARAAMPVAQGWPRRRRGLVISSSWMGTASLPKAGSTMPVRSSTHTTMSPSLPAAGANAARKPPSIMR